MIYLLAGLALVAALSGLFGAWEHEGKLAAEAQVSALQTEIEVQNQAVLALKAEGDRRVAQAMAGVKAARTATAGVQAEADRLRAASATDKPTPAGACPEKDAVAEMRRGLRP